MPEVLQPSIVKANQIEGLVTTRFGSTKAFSTLSAYCCKDFNTVKHDACRLTSDSLERGYSFAGLV